jgi:hypothetical protein
VGPIAAGLAAEARGVAHHFDRQLFGVQDLVAVEVGDGHLGRGDQIEVVHRGVVHLAFLVGQLARGEGAGCVHHVGWDDLAVSGIGGLVQEEA